MMFTNSQIHMKKIFISFSLLFFVVFSLAAQVSKPPVYIGCEESQLDALNQCFNDRLKAAVLKEFEVPAIAVNEGYKGTIKVVFLVTKEGEFEVLYVNAMYPELEEEVKRVFSNPYRPFKHLPITADPSMSAINFQLRFH